MAEVHVNEPEGEVNNATALDPEGLITTEELDNLAECWFGL